jgi:hypothetical protein
MSAGANRSLTAQTMDPADVAFAHASSLTFWLALHRHSYWFRMQAAAAHSKSEKNRTLLFSKGKGGGSS